VPAALEATRIIAILRHTDPALAVRTVEALAAGGVRAVEVTLNSTAAIEMLRSITDALGTTILVGAGTILDLADAEAALAAGARFIVSPHSDDALIAALAGMAVPCVPGAFTATEVLRAWRAGASLVKLFPAGGSGPGLVRDLRGPLSHIPLVPTGGVTLANAGAFIAAGAWGLGIGSALVDGPLVAEGRFDELTRRATAFMAIARESRLS